MLQKLLTILSFLLFNISYSQVFINEIDSDNLGFDTMEFVELKSTTANFSLDGYVLVFFNETNNLSYFAIDLDGFTTDVNGIIHFGNSLVSPPPSSSAIFANSTIQNGPDVVAIYLGNDTDFPVNTLATTSNLIDAVAYSNSSTQPTTLMAALGIPGTKFTNETTTHPRSSQRKNDGTWESKIPTPRANNDGSGIVLNYISVSVPQASYTEGESFYVSFSTSQPVTGSNLVINFSIVNGNFMVSDYTSATDLTAVIPVGQSTAQALIVIADDSSDEGDEEMLIDLQSVPSEYVINNDNIIVRIYDNDFQFQNFGKPTTPTYGLVSSTAPVGYYDSLDGLSGATLKQAVQDIIAEFGVVRLHSYADIWEILSTADRNPENNNQVWALYREEPMAKLDQQVSSSIVGKWNREHIFAQSRGGFETALGDTADGISVYTNTSASTTVDGVSDAHHIRVANGQENSSRNNKNFSNVASATDYNGPTGTLGSWKGDVARALFYMAVRFNGLNVVNGSPSEYLTDGITSSGNIGDLATLLLWHQQDPPDDFEMNRNNYIYTWQNNRNPFIDNPCLVDIIFGASVGQTYPCNTLSNNDYFESSVLVYPNPTVDHIYINGIEGKAKAIIYTITGQVVKEASFENEIRIQLELQSGMYLIEISNDVSKTTRKIIVK
jgi:endonuclease I